MTIGVKDIMSDITKSLANKDILLYKLISFWLNINAFYKNLYYIIKNIKQ